MIEKHKYLIHKYWSRIELGRKMIDSNNVSESDLLFLIPNNVKKKYGLPLTRISGKEKRKQKSEACGSYEQVFSYENLYKAGKKCIRGVL